VTRTSDSNLNELRTSGVESDLGGDAPDRSSAFIKVDDLSRELAVSRWTLYRWAREGRIPCLRTDGVVRFRVRDVVSALHARRKQSVSAWEQPAQAVSEPEAALPKRDGATSGGDRAAAAGGRSGHAERLRAASDVARALRNRARPE
jgi:excisionase family DNA binding protein